MLFEHDLSKCNNTKLKEKQSKEKESKEKQSKEKKKRKEKKWKEKKTKNRQIRCASAEFWFSSSAFEFKQYSLIFDLTIFPRLF